MPGKFESCDSELTGEFLYGLSLDGGCDSEEGSVQDNGMWYGLMRHFAASTLDDAQLDADVAGAILSEDSYGFVYYQTFTTDDELMAAWAQIEEEVSAWYGVEEEAC